jgi:hypothetical protein
VLSGFLRASVCELAEAAGGHVALAHMPPGDLQRSDVDVAQGGR